MTSPALSVEATVTGEDAVTAAVQELLRLAQDVVRISGAGFVGEFKKDCTDLSRRIALLSYLFEEIRDSKGRVRELDASASSSSSSSCLSDLTVALQAAKRLLLASVDPEIPSEGSAKKLAFQFQCVTWKLEKALRGLPYDHFQISDEVKEQVELVRAQLRRATEKYGGSLNSNLLSRTLSQPEISTLQSGTRTIGSLHIDNIGNIDHEVTAKIERVVSKRNLSAGYSSDQMISKLENMRGSNSAASSEVYVPNTIDSNNNSNENSPISISEENKKLDSPVVPDDFLCPISLEIMTDPVIVATGQTYERSYIQRWIDCGNTTCPKTQQKLQHITLTPNYVLRSLIAEWCAKHNIEQPTILANGKLKRTDGSCRDVSGDIANIESLVRKLSCSSVDERRAAVIEIRSLSKRSTDNRILIAQAGAIPALVNLLTSDDPLTQENAVTSILNLSIYENNKGLIMLAGAIPSIVQVLRAGCMETKENAAATLFSLSLADENKIIIGASGALPALVELLQNGSPSGQRDAATALYNLCIYQGNKGRAVRAGIVPVLLKMIRDSSCMVGEALTILSVLSSHPEAKVAISKASTIPVLIDLLRTGLPRNKEYAAAILLGLCKRDSENLDCLSRLGAVIPLTDLARNGTERAQRKANSLLEQLQKSKQV